MDLRQTHIPFEKKFRQFSPDQIQQISEIYHSRQQKEPKQKYQDTPELCYSANMKEIRNKDYSLIPSKYIEFKNRDENINFGEKMKSIQSDFSELLKTEEQSKNDLLNVFKELGYEIKL